MRASRLTGSERYGGANKFSRSTPWIQVTEPTTDLSSLGRQFSLVRLARQLFV